MRMRITHPPNGVKRTSAKANSLSRARDLRTEGVVQASLGTEAGLLVRDRVTGQVCLTAHVHLLT